MIPPLYFPVMIPSLMPACTTTTMRGKLDRNLKPKLAIMRGCANALPLQTDGQTDRHWHHSISARCIYYISRKKSDFLCYWLLQSVHYLCTYFRLDAAFTCRPTLTCNFLNVYTIFIARCNICIYTMSVSVCLSVCLWRKCIGAL